jgi:DUF4097 and DUF4098 domain-containing protein YvlB
MRTDTVVPLAIVLAVVSSAACSVDLASQGVVLHEERSFAGDGDDLELTLGTFDGAVAVRAWDRDEVRVVITRRAVDAARAESLTVDVSRDGNRIVVDAPQPASRGPQVRIGPGTSDSVSFSVDVPRELTLEVRTQDGRIEVHDVEGSIDLDSDDGAVTGRGLRGTIAVRTSDGSIQLGDVDGRLAARTSDGSVRVDGRFDRLAVDTSDGSVQITIREGSVMQDDWSVSTSDGSIRLDLPASFDAELEARTGDGRVRVEEGGADAGGDRRRDLRTTLGAGGRRLSLQSGDGSITIGRP